MMINRSEMRHVLGMITPEDATDQEHLDAACDHAMSELDDVMVLADKAAAGALGYHASREMRAYFTAREMRKRRNDWLRANGGYRDMMAMG